MTKKLFLIIFAFAFMHCSSNKAMDPWTGWFVGILQLKKLNKELKQYVLAENKDGIEKCFKEGASPNLIMYRYIGTYDCCNDEEYTFYALIDLISKGQEDLACLFLQHGANPNTKNTKKGHYCFLCCFRNCRYIREEEPALILAAQNNLTRVCTLLLEKGADAHAEFDGKNALTWAKQYKNQQLIRLLEDTYNVRDISQKQRSCGDLCSIQ